MTKEQFKAITNIIRHAAWDKMRDELCASLANLYESSQWQPIETAPRDGTYHLAARKSDDAVGIVRFNADSCESDCDICYQFDELSYWKPLSDPPSAAK